MCYSPIVQSGGKFTLKFSTVRWGILFLADLCLVSVTIRYSIQSLLFSLSL